MAVTAVTGLEAEARIARRSGLEAIATGGRPKRIEASVLHAIGKGATVLLSFGVAGGLDPELTAGSLVIGTLVRAAHEEWPCDAALQARLGGRLPAARLAPIAHAGEPVATVAAKRRLRAATAAACVDLESGIAARLAHEAGLPFVVLRAIADSAHSELPQAALVGLAEDGTTALEAVIGSCLVNPWQVPRLIGLAIETRRALLALVGAGRALGEVFAGV